MTGNSQVPKDVLLANLRQLAPEIFTEGKVDWERLKATLGEEVEFSNERYVLNWAGKSDAFQVLQTPSTRTLAPAKEESVDFENTGNIFIEGENLEVLKILQKSYFGKIKMIYIDPPYNTGNDSFIYPDKFSETKDEYQKRVGDKDEEGYMTREGMFRKNSRENGQYHSNWLNMMYPRLFLARNLLRDDGVIFVSIDDNEVHNLRLMMNEIFGEENFISQFVWRTDGNFDNQAKIKNCHEYILLFAKSEALFPHPPVVDPNVPETSKLYKEEIRNTIVKNGPKNPISVIDIPIGFPCDFKEGLIKQRSDNYPFYRNDAIVNEFSLKNNVKVESGWSSKELLMKFIENGLTPILDNKGQETSFIISKTGAIEVIKKRSERKSHVISVLNNMGGSQKATNEIEELGLIFDDYPKPTLLIKYLIQMVDDDDFIAFDFFAGSGTLAHSIISQNSIDGGNRKFISVQLPEEIAVNKKAYNAGFKTISEICKNRIKKAINFELKSKAEKLQFNNESQDLGFKVFKLSESNFKIWRSQGIETAEELEKQMALFTDPVSENAAAEPMVYELLLKSGFDLNSPVEHQNGVYRIGNGELALLIETVSDELISKVIQSQPQKVIALDRLFEGNDQLKTNTALQMKDANIDFKTI
jgi:adenine-specific DNA-methyltransferase